MEGVRTAHPDRAAATFQPVVEDDARDLTALAGARAIAEEPAAPEPDGVVSRVGRRLDDVPGRIDVPRTGEMAAMRFASENDGFALGVGQDAVDEQPGRKARTNGKSEEGRVGKEWGSTGK